MEVADIPATAIPALIMAGTATGLAMRAIQNGRKHYASVTSLRNVGQIRSFPVHLVAQTLSASPGSHKLALQVSASTAQCACPADTALTLFLLDARSAAAMSLTLISTQRAFATTIIGGIPADINWPPAKPL